jgi:hypothetical protein
MALDTLPKELLVMVLSNLHNRHDREIWRRVCKLTNAIYLEERLSRTKVYAKNHNIDIMSDEAALHTLEQFHQWTQVAWRSNEVAVKTARSVLKAHLDGSRRLQGTDDLGDESEDEDFEEPEMTPAGQAIVNTLHTYIGDQNSESHLRVLLRLDVHDTAWRHETLSVHDTAWAQALFRAWARTHTFDSTSTFGIAHLLIRQYMSGFRLTDGVVRRIQATFGSDRFRAFFRDLLMGDNEKIFAALEMSRALEKPEIWFTQDALDISKSRGYPLTGYAVQRWAQLHDLALERGGNKEGQIEFCKTMLITVQKFQSARLTEHWERRTSRVLCASAGVTNEAGVAQPSVIHGASCTNARITNMSETRLGVSSAEEKSDPILVLASFGHLVKDVCRVFLDPIYRGRHHDMSVLFSHRGTREILTAQRSIGDQNNLLLSRERMKVLAIACGLRSMIYHDLIIRAEDESHPSAKEQYMRAARTQKLGMREHLAEWEQMVEQKGYPTSWKGLLGKCCDRTEQGSREYWKDGHAFGRRVENAKEALKGSKEKTIRELQTKRQLAQEVWGIAPVENKRKDSRSWQLEWAESPADALWADLTKGCALFGQKRSGIALTSSDIEFLAR